MDAIQEQALTQHYRNVWAKMLRKERALFRAGLDAILTSNIKPSWDPFDFIKIEKVVWFTWKGNIPFDDLSEEVNKARNNQGEYDTNADISLDVNGPDTDRNEFYADPDHIVGTIVSIRYKFSNLKTIKALIHGCSIKNMLSDAKWKLAHQSNGKDAKRYLRIIEKQLTKV